MSYYGNGSVGGMFNESLNDSRKVRRELRLIREDSRERARTDLFGREAIHGAVKCILWDIFAIVLAFLAYLLFGKLKFEATVLFKTLLLIVLIGGAGLTLIATLFMHIRYFRYVRYQKRVNGHPIARRAKGWCVFSLLFNLAIIIGAALFILFALMAK